MSALSLEQLYLLECLQIGNERKEDAIDSLSSPELRQQAQLRPSECYKNKKVEEVRQDEIVEVKPSKSSIFSLN